MSFKCQHPVSDHDWQACGSFSVHSIIWVCLVDKYELIGGVVTLPRFERFTDSTPIRMLGEASQLFCCYIIKNSMTRYHLFVYFCIYIHTLLFLFVKPEPLHFEKVCLVVKMYSRCSLHVYEYIHIFFFLAREKTTFCL